MFSVQPSAINKIPRRAWTQLRQEVIKIFKMKPVEQQRLKVLHRLLRPSVILKSNPLQLRGADRKLGFSVKQVKQIAASGK